MAVADAAVVANPSSSAAWSLKTLCHERKLEIAEALECAEKLVELNPDSELDKIKRNALRTRLQADLRPVETPNRGMALFGASMAVVLVAAIGVGIARITSNSQERPAVVDNRAAGDPGAAQFGLGGNGGTTPVTGTAEPGKSATPNGANTPPVQDMTNQPGPGDVPNIDNRNRQNGQESSPRVSVPNVNSGLPPIGDYSPPIDQGQLRLQPDEQTNQDIVEPKAPAKPDKKNDPQDLPPDQGNPKPVDDSMSGIEITVTRTPGTRPNPAAGGSTPVMNSNGLETLVRVGSQSYQLGNYNQAAKSYEQALLAGGDRIILNQRIGQSYERLGRSSDAAAAYKACIAACEAAISSGKGNRSRLESVKASAEQALKVLQGG